MSVKYTKLLLSPAAHTPGNARALYGYIPYKCELRYLRQLFFKFIAWNSKYSKK
jgi:hypothetical protein